MSRLPVRVLIGFVACTVVAIVAATVWGWLPSRESSGIVVTIYFAVLLAVLSVSYIVSGSTLTHHYRTGTVYRRTNPGTFWAIVAGQLAISAALAVVAYLSWRS
jgi:multisubunit Na+/H+ antiporter MnhB subunit